MRSTVLLLLAAVAAPGCVSMGVVPDDGAVAYARLEPLSPPRFPSATVSVTGAYFGAGLRYPGVIEHAQQRAWMRIRDALVAKGVAAAVEGGEASRPIEVFFEFLLEDDDHPLHRGFSRLTLFLFPHWKMVRCAARARCRADGELLPDFQFEDEVLVYRSWVLLPFGPFHSADPVDRLFTAAGQALAAHVVRWTRRDLPARFALPGMEGHE